MSHESLPKYADRDDVAFRALDLRADRAVLIEFARDLFRISFSDPGYFSRRFGSDGEAYVDWLRARTRGNPTFTNLATLAGEPVGMMVVGPEPGEPTVGHLYHLYLRPDAKGRGLGSRLERHALSILHAAGFEAAQLNVGIHNAAALGFYVKQGWAPVETNGLTNVIVMRKRLSDCIDR